MQDPMVYQFAASSAKNVRGEHLLLCSPFATTASRSRRPGLHTVTPALLPVSAVAPYLSSNIHTRVLFSDRAAFIPAAIYFILSRAHHGVDIPVERHRSVGTRRRYWRRGSSPRHWNFASSFGGWKRRQPCPTRYFLPRFHAPVPDKHLVGRVWRVSQPEPVSDGCCS